jgi:glycosyltransferase involved in cell wall biosynthesis
MSGPDTILALIPAYQEGPRIAAVVAGAGVHLPVVVVDDGSSDDTAQVAEAAGATVLRQVPNAGKGAALRAGFRHALDAGAAAVVTLDADGQHDPDEIPRFLVAFAAASAGCLRSADSPTRSVGRPSRWPWAGGCPTTSPAIGSSGGP